MKSRTVTGTVKTWNSEAGWGVLVSPDAPAEVWVHFSAIEGDGYRELSEGATVEFAFRKVLNQDGYRFVAGFVRVA